MGTPGGPVTLRMSDIVIENLDHKTLKIKDMSDLASAEKDVEDGKAWAAIVFPPDFSSVLFSRMSQANYTGPTSVNITIILDNSNPNMGVTVVREVNEAILSAFDQISEKYNVSKADIPIKTAIVYKYGSKDLRFIDYFAPGIMGFAIMMITVMITIVTFVEERSMNTMDRLLASPLTEGEIVLGTSAAFSLLGLGQSLVLLATAKLLFGVEIVGGGGQLALALLFIILIAIGHQGLGMLLSAGARNELQAIQFLPLVLFPSILLTGMFWPVESIPPVLQPVSKMVPLTYGIDALRSVMLRGWGLGHPTVLLDLGVLLLFACLTIGLSVLMLKRRK
jgi:ABC-2 type transport system permease protein